MAITCAPWHFFQAITSGDMSTAPKKVDLLIVGAGLSGAVIAERCSKVALDPAYEPRPRLPAARSVLHGASQTSAGRGTHERTAIHTHAPPARTGARHDFADHRRPRPHRRQLLRLRGRARHPRVQVRRAPLPHQV
eukprot:1153531-Prymnesium_polylepis.2